MKYLGRHRHGEGEGESEKENANSSGIELALLHLRVEWNIGGVRRFAGSQPQQVFDE